MPGINDLLGQAGVSQYKSLLPDQRPPARDESSRLSTFSPQQLSMMSLEQGVNSEIAQMVAHRFDLSKQARRDKWMIWNKCWDHYRGIYDASNKEKWQSKVFMPSTVKVIETVMAQLSSALIGPEMPAEWESVQPENGSQVENVNDLVSFDMKKSDFRVTFGSDFLRELCMLGTSIGKVGYQKVYQDVMVKQRMESTIDLMLRTVGANPGSMNERMIPKRMLVKDWAKFEYRNLYDIYPEPYTHEMNGRHWIIEKSLITNNELIVGAQQKDPYFRLDNITPQLLSTTPGSFAIHEDPEKQIIKRALNRIPVAMHYLDPDRPHELYEYWGPVPRGWIFPELRNDPVAKYESVPAWIWVVDRQWVVRKRLNPYRDGDNPYVRGHYIRIPGEWYGVGVAELMMGLQIEKNELRNTRIDNVNLILNKIVAVLKDRIAQQDWERLVSEPGAIWVFKGIDDIKQAIMPIEWPDITKDAYIASKEIDDEIQEVTAANAVTVGAGGGADESGGNTFRGQLLNQQTAGQRFMQYARVLEICGLSDAYRKYYNRIYQFKSFDQILGILGQKRFMNFMFLPPEQLEMMANLTPKGVLSIENKGIKLAQLGQTVQQFQGQPWFKEIEIAREEFLCMGYPDPDKFVFSEQEVQMFTQMQNQMMQQQQQMMMGHGMPPPQPGQQGPQGAQGIQPREMNGQRKSPMGQPVAGGIPSKGVTHGARPPLAAVGPGASPMDMIGHPLG